MVKTEPNVRGSSPFSLKESVLAKLIQIKDLDSFERVYLKKNNVDKAFLFILPIPPQISKAITAGLKLAPHRQGNSSSNNQDSLALSESLALDASLFTLKNSTKFSVYDNLDFEARAQDNKKNV